MTWYCGMDLRVMIGRFVEVGKKKDLKVNADKNKVIALGGERRKNQYGRTL